jgi:hypothetical protein
LIHDFPLQLPLALIETESVQIEEKLIAGSLFRDANSLETAKHDAAMDKHCLLLILVFRFILIFSTPVKQKSCIKR